MKMMKSLTQQLHMLGIISTNINDNAYEQYQDFIKSNFDLISYEDSDRLDEFFFPNIENRMVSCVSQITMIIWYSAMVSLMLKEAFR